MSDKPTNDRNRNAPGAPETLDRRVFVALVDAIATARYPGINRPRGYALRDEIYAQLPDVPHADVWSSLCSLMHAGKVGQYYDRDGCRYYLKG